MKFTQRFSIAFSLLVVALMSAGCASNCGSGSCPGSGSGLFGTSFLEGQPVRRTVRSWFQGDSCDTCNTPAGQLSQPLGQSCDNCIGGGQVFDGGQVTSQFGGQPVQPLYGSPTVSGVQPSGSSSQFAPQPGVTTQFAPQPGPVGSAVGSTSRGIGNIDAGNFGSLGNPPSL